MNWLDAPTAGGGAHRHVYSGHRLRVKWQDHETDTVASFRALDLPLFCYFRLLIMLDGLSEFYKTKNQS